MDFIQSGPRVRALRALPGSSLRTPNADFQAAGLLARLLEGGEAPGTLSRDLALAEGDLRAAFARQGAATRQGLERAWGASALAAALDLARESDPQMFFEGLLALGRDLENRDQLQAAAQVYVCVQQALAGAGTEGATGSDWRGALQHRARERLQVMQGAGPAGARFEFLSRRLATQALDPAMLLGMTAAGMAFRLTRVATLGRLVSAPTASFLTRGILPRALAYSGGLFAESLAFTAGVRSGNALLGREQDWSSRALGREWASGAMTLLALRATGTLAQGTLARLGQGQGLSLGLARALFPQAGMLGGILLSHRLEASLGLRPEAARGNELTEALATLIQFNLAGRVSQGLLGARWAAWERGLDVQAESLARSAPLFPRLPGIFTGSSPEALAVAGFAGRRPGLRSMESLSELMSRPLLMSSEPPGSKGRGGFTRVELSRQEPANAEAKPQEGGILSHEEFEGLWLTLRMNTDPKLRGDLIRMMLDEAKRSPDAVAFLISAREAEGNFQGRAEILEQIEAGLRTLDVSTLEEFARGNPYALRGLFELGSKTGNVRALRAIQGMDFSPYAERFSNSPRALIDIAAPLRYAFEGENASAEALVRGLTGDAVEGISREAQREIQVGSHSNAAKAVFLLGVIGRSGGGHSVSALRLLREFPVELYENAEIEEFTIEALYLMAQAGNEMAGDALSGIDLQALRPGVSGLLLKLYRYGSEHSLEDLNELAQEGDLGAVSVLHDLALAGLRSADHFLERMDPAEILRQARRSDRALYTMGLLAQHRNPAVLREIGASPQLGNRLRGLLNADPYQLISVITPEMVVDQHGGMVEGFDALPLRAREGISRWVVETWQAEPNKEAYYHDNPSGLVTPDLIPGSFIERQIRIGMEQYRQAGEEAPPPRRSGTRPSDRPAPQKPKRFLN